MLPSAASVPATAAPLALLVTVTLVALPCATCTTIGVSGFTPWVPGLIDTTGRTGAAVVGGAGTEAGSTGRRRAAGGDGQTAAEGEEHQHAECGGQSCAGREAVPSVRSHSIRSGVSDPPILTHATGRPAQAAPPVGGMS